MIDRAKEFQRGTIRPSDIRALQKSSALVAPALFTRMSKSPEPQPPVAFSLGSLCLESV
jgi:hypothetical protein